MTGNDGYIRIKTKEPTHIKTAKTILISRYG